MKNIALLLCGLFIIQTTIYAQAPLWLRYTAISPDGKEILFTYNADIYKVPASGGQAIAMTLFEGRDFMPVWSPDGQKIAFASDRHGNFDVYIMNADGSELKRLTYHSSHDYPYAFSADGSMVLFSSTRADGPKSTYFPSGRLPETYQVPVKGGKEKLISSVPMEEISVNKDGSKWLYQDKKGYEDPFRKRHTSSVTRDIWIYHPKENKHERIVTWNGEDRDPVWINEKEFYYLSEEGGAFNVWKFDITSKKGTQVTKFEHHPVRNLSKADNGTICFNYDGEIYTLEKEGQPQKVNIQISTGPRYEDVMNELKSGGVTEMDVSPDGKEICYVIRGEVFVTALKSGTTKRITNTPEQERNASFSPDGKSIIYAAEKNNKWGIYRTVRAREEETHFFNATILKEEPLVVNEQENFQPKYNHDGTEIAYLENRTAVKVYNLESKKTREVLPRKMNYSYSDGDQWFDWSPDGKYLLVNFLEPRSWISQVGLVEASGKGKVLNLTESGYGANNPMWMLNGDMMIFFSGRNGMKNHASWGFQGDVYGLFFNKKAYDRFNLNEMELDVLKEQEKADKSEEESDEIAVKIDFDGLLERKKRLTIHSSQLSGGLISKDGEKLYYVCRFEKGYDLWVHDFYKNETKLFQKLGAGSVRSLQMDKEGKNIFLVANGQPKKIDLAAGKQEAISIKADFRLDPAAEREYIFEHAWRQVVEKFYLEDLHGVDWDFYREAYRKFLPHIDNNYDFAEMLSELLGELNASHTGCRYNARHKNPDHTASFGVIFDPTYEGKGEKIAKILAGSPLLTADSEVKVGAIISAINGIPIDNENTIEKLMNRMAGKTVLIALEEGKKKWEERVKPINQRTLNELLYKQWVKDREDDVERLSEGRLGYVHVQGMNDASFRVVYEKALGKYGNKEALIVDTRFNGGGWLHDDLATFLNGEKYFSITPRDQDLGDEPMFKWHKPSVVLMGEGNYSDAHMFPEVYKTLKIGKLIGMPVPGTATAVWWETQIDPSLVFGIPQVGIRNPDGRLLENKQLEPDIKVRNTPEKAENGEDQQLKAAVEEMLR
jgi:Tol biopolymer transport system component/C-terminal processing protease CtpA/Prc